VCEHDVFDELCSAMCYVSAGEAGRISMLVWFAIRGMNVRVDVSALR
jgi:hypothetical protein